jgi:LysM repeat protein
MKAKYFSFFIFLFLINFAFTANAENLYILFDENCMDKLEYDQSQKGNYMVYRVNAGGGESIILEVGTESKIGQDALPRPFIGCYNGSFDMLLVNRINARPDEVYMVVPKGRKYFITPIVNAAHYKNDSDVITYVSPKYSFKFDLKNGFINENIAYKNIRAKVYFDGRLDNDCSGVYLFRQTTRNTSGAYASLKFIPEIGIVEERLNVSPRNTGEVALSLNKINDKRYEKYLESLCAKASEETITFDPSYKPDAYNVTPVRPTPNTPDMVRKNNTEEFTRKGGEQPVAKFHIVKRGETLYGIAKKYDITLGDLKSWNNKKSSVIHSGEKYIVSAPQEEEPEVMEETLTEKGGIVWEKGKQSSSTAAEWDKNTAGTHIVQRGETIASIAMKYGYTETRFRKMNNLSKNAYAKVGQPLSTTDCNCPSTLNTLTAKSVEGFPLMNTTGSALPFVDDPAEPTRTLEPSPYNTRASRPASYEAKPYDPFTATSASRSTIKSAAPENRAVQHYDTPINTGNYYKTPTSTYGQPRPYQEPVTYPSTQADEGFVPDEFTVKGVAPASATPAAYNAKNPKRIQHTVQEGDNLFRIARQYGVTVEHLRSINNLELNEIIIPYQKIYIH